MRVGVLFPLSGSGAAWGRDCADGVLTALELRPDRDALESHVADATDPAAAARLVGRDRTSLVFGTLFTALALDASQAVASRGAAYAEVAAVADELGARGLTRFVRTCPRASAFGARAVDFAIDVLGGRRLAVVHEDSGFGRSLGTAIGARARTRGLEPVASLAPAPETEDFGPVIEALAAGRADVVLAASYTEFSRRLWRALRSTRGGIDALIGVGGGWLHLGEDADVDPSGVYAVDVAPAEALAGAGLFPETRLRRDEYRRAYRERAGRDASVYSDLGFAGADLLLGAFIGADGDPDRFVARAGDVDVAPGGTFLGYGARFDAAGENERAAPVVMQHRAGALPVVHPPDLATERPDSRALLA